MSSSKKEGFDPTEFLGQSSGILEGVANILGRLGELAEKGEHLKQTFGSAADGTDRPPVIDFNFKVGTAKPRNQVPSTESEDYKSAEHTRDRTADSNSSDSTFEKQREANVEIIDQPDCLLLVAEMPGVTKENIKITRLSESITICGHTARTEFVKSLQLQSDQYAEAEFELNNGILEIRLPKISTE